MELITAAIFVVPALLAVYAIIEESILRRYGFVDTVDEWQAYLDCCKKWEEDEVTPPAYTLLDRLTNIIRW